MFTYVGLVLLLLALLVLLAGDTPPALGPAVPITFEDLPRCPANGWRFIPTVVTNGTTAGCVDYRALPQPAAGAA
ncbi:hypothetical protein [Pseudonocardia lacus]|uniref:hypothetical protein n=1 Tax=Pseudonocardia lacus TaxID=2835865 RepID=UPI001BDC7779|nr:hypothetical protein [Pseudonocardia lacus]